MKQKNQLSDDESQKQNDSNEQSSQDNEKEVVIDLTTVEMSTQKNRILSRKDSIAAAETVIIQFADDLIYADDELIQILSQFGDKELTFVKGNQSSVIKSSDLKDDDFLSRWGDYSLDLLMQEKKANNMIQVMEFSAIIKQITDDGYIARGNESNLHPDLILHLISDNKSFKEGDLVDFIAPIDTRFFDGGEVDVECVALLDSKRTENYDYRSWEELYGHKVYYARSSENVDIVLDDSEVNVWLSSFDFNSTKCEQITLHWRGSSFVWTPEIQMNEFGDSETAYRIMHLPLAFTMGKVCPEAEVKVDTARITDIGDRGFIAIPIMDKSLHNEKFVFVPILLPESMEIGYYVDLTYQYIEEDDSFIFWYVKWVPNLSE